MATNIEVNNLKINKLSEDTLSSMEKGGNIEPNQIFLTDDSDDTMVNVEQVETIYDMNNSSKDWGYSGGINGNLTKFIDNKYKKLRIYYRCYLNSNEQYPQLNTGGTSNVIDIDLNETYGGYSTASNLNMYRVNYSFVTNTPLGIFIEYNRNTGDLGIQFGYNNTKQTEVSYYHAYKIEGVY
jgi:hypothetical protein